MSRFAVFPQSGETKGLRASALNLTTALTPDAAGRQSSAPIPRRSRPLA